jgi:hypothetical protein
MRTNYYCAGKASPAARVREVFTRPECRRKALLAAFTLSSVHCKIPGLVLTQPGQSGEYDADPVERKICLELGCGPGKPCLCSECLCCSYCAAECDCTAAIDDPDTKLEQLLIPERCPSFVWVSI